MSGRRRGRPGMGAVSGFLFGISASLLLLTVGHVAVDSSVLLVLPILFLVAGTVWAFWAPLRKRPPAVFAPPPSRRPAFTTPAPPTSVVEASPPAPDPTAPAVVVPESSGESTDESGGGSSAV